MTADAIRSEADAVEIWCDWCDKPVLTPVRDEVAVSWIGDGASTYCSRGCLERHAEHRINAAGNEPS